MKEAHQGMGSMYRAADGPPGEYSPKSKSSINDRYWNRVHNAAKKIHFLTSPVNPMGLSFS